MQKHPAQVLFNRLIRTWVEPAAAARVKDPSIKTVPLLMALIKWKPKSHQPDVFINDEVRAHIDKVQIRAAKPFAAGPIGPQEVGGIERVTLRGGEAFHAVHILGRRSRQ
jgi:hypothetical protein